MPEHIFVCGLSPAQRSQFPGATHLSLDKENGNLVLRLERLRNRLVGSEPKRLTDFIEIASYVFAADRTTSRGPLSDVGFGANWRRLFRLVIAVREIAFWQRPEVTEALSEALRFLSEDWWTFNFIENFHPIPFQDYLDLKSPVDDATGDTSIVLFSGGLDSLAGAVHELRTSNRRIVLVSHRNLPGIGARQQEIAEQLIIGFPGRVTHVWVDNSLTSKLDDCEETQRTRSFFFTALATVTAHIKAADRIRFYENGVMSINLPLATQLVGARSSRSTHPRSLQLLGRVVHFLALHEISVENPFAWMTKSEVVAELAATPQASLIRTSVSCTRARTANRKYQPHCGTCIQCLQRRLSTLIGGAQELDESEGYETDFLTGAREDGPERVAALEAVSLALDCAATSESHFLSRFSGQLAWVLQAHPEEERDEVGKNVIDLYRRHGRAVHALLIECTKLYATDVVDRTLSPDSLLALVLASRLSEAVAMSEETPQRHRLADEVVDVEEARADADGIVIAVDTVRQSIRIRDRAELSGPTIFAIMQLLIALSLEDRGQPGHPVRYRALRAKEIADRLNFPDESSVRAAVKRARNQLKDDAVNLGEPDPDDNAVIESVRRGYRLNPKVIVVDVQEIDG